MIHYRLRCGGGHEFEGWFRSSDAFDTQSRTGLLNCPRCGTSEVARGLMAPAVRTSRARLPPTDSVPATPTVPASGTPSPRLSTAMPDELRAALQRLRAQVEQHCDDLGDGFADEAIRMSRGEVAARGIYGNVTDDDRDALAEEGVDVMQIPWLKPAEG